MSIKTILTGVSGGTASDGAIELSCQLAKRFDAHLEGYHIQLDPLALAAMASVGGYAMPMNGDWLDRLNRETGELAGRLRKTFGEAIRRHGIALAGHPGPGSASAAWRDEIGYAPKELARA